MVYERAASKEHLDPWFDDGNIILVAEGKCFKVYRGMLSLHSPIFKDMLSCPQPVDQEEEESDGEGCPVIHLQQDSATEVQHVLRALFCGEYVIARVSLMPMSVATALLRLGKKYEIKLLFNHVSGLMKACYSVELPSDSGPLRFEGTITERDPHDFQFLNVAREVGLLSVLPVALYVCASSTDIKELFNGYEWEGVHYSLSPINQRACIIGRDQRSELAKRVFPERLGQFCFSGPCKACSQMGATVSFLADPFALWDSNWDRMFCKWCAENCKSKYG
ncbi:hypothetical protein F5J12DRAFT_724029 [Pisolithus orientalis]|uniref:uncharacterized protein n=1 Tax=Pisolithus orientalis TaxID=936130 RepID=UPI00222559D1|nr:uncharacterized protein F5J12DRAFT_724029 [Pisolithus orientalis]KAI6000305.1 hypothetical protein F5J12DRAFT_724029 [Pisolithus orientalis]